MLMDHLFLPPTIFQTGLPTKVVQLILHHVISQSLIVSPNSTNISNMSFLWHDHVSWLLGLRWLGCAWDCAILPIVFQALQLARDKMTISLASTWESAFQIQVGLNSQISISMVYATICYPPTL
ncbi:hypothetical protein DFH28DRAFT_980691 [Melampsora americana]|nr:hypothetical protein DFH28DRAFT_980691 [Melampsora americana]